MQKRGQVTVFVIIGIVLIIIIALIFFARNNLGVGVNTQNFLHAKLDPIQDNIIECIDNNLPQAVETLGKQGGDFSPASYRRYQSKEVKYYCLEIPDKDTCLNIMPTKNRIKQNLQDYIAFQLDNCIDRSQLKSRYGYTITKAEPTAHIDFTDNAIEVTVNYPIKIEKSGTTVTMPEVKRVYNNVPIAQLYDVAVDITNAKATNGFFDQLTYMLQNQVDVIINVDKPHPDTIYKLNKRDSTYEWWFAVQGDAA